MRNVPPWIWLVAAGLYVVCPLDGDFIPLVGWLDDVIVAYLGIRKWRTEKRAVESSEETTVLRVDVE